MRRKELLQSYKKNGTKIPTDIQSEIRKFAKIFKDGYNDRTRTQIQNC